VDGCRELYERVLLIRPQAEAYWAQYEEMERRMGNFEHATRIEQRRSLAFGGGLGSRPSGRASSGGSSSRRNGGGVGVDRLFRSFGGAPRGGRSRADEEGDEEPGEERGGGRGREDRQGAEAGRRATGPGLMMEEAIRQVSAFGAAGAGGGSGSSSSSSGNVPLGGALGIA
jgi:hypothetical protein